MITKFVMGCYFSGCTNGISVEVADSPATNSSMVNGEAFLAMAQALGWKHLDTVCDVAAAKQPFCPFHAKRWL